MQKAIPFTEAAIPTYTNENAYRASRARNPEYGPLHFRPSGFDADNSYSSTPVPFEFGTEVTISTRSNRIAYDLRPYHLLDAKPTLGGISKYTEPNWQKGSALVLLLLRKEGVSQSEYIGATATLFDTISNGVLMDLVDGHYARVNEGHILQFINVPKKNDIAKAVEKINSLIERSSLKDALINYDFVVAESLWSFADGWTSSIGPGKAVNVQFSISP